MAIKRKKNRKLAKTIKQSLCNNVASLFDYLHDFATRVYSTTYIMVEKPVVQVFICTIATAQFYIFLSATRLRTQIFCSTYQMYFYTFSLINNNFYAVGDNFTDLR